ncbi:hypothetical protein ACS0TY_023985 [Phlomoides rotata]
MIQQGQAVADHVRNRSQQILKMFPVAFSTTQIHFFKIQKPIDAGILIRHCSTQKGLDVTIW